MLINFVSSSSENQFLELIDEGGGETYTLLCFFMDNMPDDSKHDSGVIDMSIDDQIQCRIENSPFLVIFNEATQKITLQQCDDDDDDIFLEVSEWDYDEDAVEEVIDYMDSRILTGETYGI